MLAQHSGRCLEPACETDRRRLRDVEKNLSVQSQPDYRNSVGLLAVDVSSYGVVMSADSQPVELLDHETRVLAQPGQRRTRNPILIRDAGGFVGLTGFVGTETIGGRTTREWLTAFDARHPEATLSEYASALGGELTEEWKRLQLRSILEILITGVESEDVRFVYG
jgi:hypothetical protein